MDVFRQIIQEIGEDKLKYCFVYSAAGKRTRSDEADDEAIDEYILKQMQGILKYTFPNTTCNSYTGVDSKAMRKHKLEAFANGQLNVLFAKNCLDEGVDIPRAQNAIFISSTGNPRQFIQRRGRVLRTCKGKNMAHIWDLIVMPPNITETASPIERSLFTGEVKRILNFAALADNKIDILYGELHNICMTLNIDMFQLLEDEEKQYK